MYAVLKACVDLCASIPTLQFSEMEAMYEKACREIDEMAEALMATVSIFDKLSNASTNFWVKVHHNNNDQCLSIIFILLIF